MTKTEVTYSRRLAELIAQLATHPYREEILKLAQEQVNDDTLVLADIN